MTCRPSSPPIAPYLLPDEIKELQQLIRDIATGEVAPRAAQLDEKSEYGWEIRKILAENDISASRSTPNTAAPAPAPSCSTSPSRNSPKADASTALQLMTQELGTLPIKLFGSDEMKQRILPACATGEAIPAFGLSEPGAGSDPAGMVTSARLDGDEWVINGTKNWITNTGIATFYVVFAVTAREPKREVTAFLVEADRPGVSVGKLEHKMGMRSSPTGQPIFDDVRVPASNVIGEVGKGMRASPSAPCR